MKILLDEQVPVFFAEAIARLLPKARVDHVANIKWKSKKDIPLYADAKTRGYTLIITNDLRQLEDPEETKAIKRSGLHHLRYRRKGRGLAAQAGSLASLVAALPAVVEVIESVQSQRLFLAHSLSLTQSARVEVTDPKMDPPRYWR
ncbi:MAG: hypothetical protein WCP28_04635 [Actinomycetes bacterium]